ncbi:hypothetical protein DFJ74DRAFT_641564 [Hyaloraphidium curvatum]|nr:hypothetical protein DFJ74DRAFT_641564 [Hyaloraphidium curvatum]
MAPLPTASAESPPKKELPEGADPEDGPDAQDGEDGESESGAADYKDGQRVYRCRWEECEEVFPVLDDLVKHVNDGGPRDASVAALRHENDGNLTEHTAKFKKKGEFVCSWLNCPRKGLSQASRFALVTHIRSHTGVLGPAASLASLTASPQGEKPYVCSACKKGFKRSDALAKHKVRCLQPAAEAAAGLPGGTAGGAELGSVSAITDPDELLSSFATTSKEKYMLQKAKYRQLLVERRLLEDEYSVARTKILRLRAENELALERVTGRSAGTADVA